MKNNYRHGDVILKRAAIIPDNATKKTHLVLAEGESTGHLHEIKGGKAELYEFNETLYLKVISDIAKLDHPEHGCRELPRGIYEIDIQKEWSEDGWENVID